MECVDSISNLLFILNRVLHLNCSFCQRVVIGGQWIRRVDIFRDRRHADKYCNGMMKTNVRRMGELLNFSVVLFILHVAMSYYLIIVISIFGCSCLPC